MNHKECCSNKKKERDEKEYKDLLNRLRRIEGQVRGSDMSFMACLSALG